MKANKKGFLAYFNSKKKISSNTDLVLDEVSPPKNTDRDKAEMFKDLLKEVIVQLVFSAASPQVLCAVLGTTKSKGYETFSKHPNEITKVVKGLKI